MILVRTGSTLTEFRTRGKQVVGQRTLWRLAGGSFCSSDCASWPNNCPGLMLICLPWIVWLVHGLLVPGAKQRLFQSTGKSRAISWLSTCSKWMLNHVLQPKEQL